MDLASIQRAKNWIDSQTPAGVIDPTKSAIPPIQLQEGWNLIGNVSQYTWHWDKSLEIVWNGALNTYTTNDVFQIIKTVNGSLWSPLGIVTTGRCAPGEAVVCYFRGPNANSLNNIEYFHPNINPTQRAVPDINVTLDFQRTGYVSGIEYRLYPGWNYIAYTGHEPVSLANVPDVLQNALLLSSPEDSFIPVDVAGGNIIDVIAGQSYGTSAGSNVNDHYNNIETILTNPDLESVVQLIKDISGEFWAPNGEIGLQLYPGGGYSVYIRPEAIPAGSTLTINFQRNV